MEPLVFSLLLTVSSVFGADYSNEVKLLHTNDGREESAFVEPQGSLVNLTKYLLNKHTADAPPDGVLELSYELELVHILGIDELKQTMTALVYVDEKWTDPSLSWDPAEFNGLLKTWLPMSKVWIPDIIIFNMLNHDDLLESIRAPVMIYHNGTIECSHPAVYTVSCEINIKHFPLDDQRCSLEVASWAYGDDKIRLHANVRHSLEHYAPNEEWHLLNVTVHEQEYEHEDIYVSELKYDIKLRRKPLFYMVTLTFPSYVMCAISVVGLFARFSTTGEREERFTLGVTAILTMAVLSLVVSEKVPHSSTSIPLLVGYFLFNMVVVAAAAMTTGLVMRIHRRGRFGDHPPTWVLRVFRIDLEAEAQRHLRYGTLVAKANYGIPTGKFDKTTFLGVLAHSSLRGCGCPLLLLPTERSVLSEGVTQYLAKYASRNTNAVAFVECNRRERMKLRAPNGWVLVSERLDWVLMIFFLVLVTVPVIILFILT